RPYIREYRPVLIGVDGGADALLEAGYRPDMIVGDMDSVSDDALTCGAEIVVHAYRDGRAPGLKRVQELGQEAVTFPATATSEDIAMLLADDKGASLIVAVGTHANMVEFLDKGRAGMASTFLTRLRVGSKLVDAKGVSRLYRSRISTWSLLFLVFGALVAIVIAVAVSPAGDVISPLLADRWHAFVFWLTGRFTCSISATTAARSARSSWRWRSASWWAPPGCPTRSATPAASRPTRPPSPATRPDP